MKEEIAFMKEETRKECVKRIEEANATVQNLLFEGKKEYNRLLECYQADYEKWKKLRDEMDVLETSEPGK